MLNTNERIIMSKIIEFPNPKGELEKFYKDAGEISAELASELQTRCMQRNIKPGEAVAILLCLIGRISGKYHDPRLSMADIWTGVTSNENSRPFFEMGFKNEIDKG